MNKFLVIKIILKSLAVLIPLLGVVAYYTYAERRVIGYMQSRIGPNRVGPLGLFQPIADGIKLLFKEISVPCVADKYLYYLAPVFTIVPILSAWAVMPFSLTLIIADVNLSLLYLIAMTSLGVYGIILAGWSSNSRYALLGAMRSAAQIISYEVALGFVLIGVLLATSSLNLREIVLAQSGGILHWLFIPLFPLFVVYWLTALMETNRAPFDVAEGESEIVAGFHVEYSGILFAIFFLAEYCNMILLSFLASIMFFGGWLSPFNEHVIPGALWLIAKSVVLMFSFLWFRATFPRYRYDQIMRLGWKFMIPVTLLWIIVTIIFVRVELKPWF